LVTQPLATWGFIVGSMSTIGVPLFAIFLSKFMILYELSRVSPALVITVLAFMVIVAAAFGIMVLKMVSNFDKDDKPIRFPFNMKLPVIILILLVILLGISIPGGLTGIINNIVGGL
jgi:hydrogenase-4 component F